MANNVFANNREISCKKADAKTICCFPDVCFTPPDKVPPTPPGVPIPYPNTAFAKDTAKGSKKVKISGAEIIQKNKSYYKTSTGNEAGCAQKKGIITSKTKGKAYYTSWSMDVKIEGQNVARHLDLTTHNHGSSTNTGPWPNVDTVSTPTSKNCKKDRGAKEKACEGKEDPHCPGVLARTPKNLKEQVAKSPDKRGPDVLAMDDTKRGKESRTSKAGKAAAREANADDCVKKSRCQMKPYKPTKGQPKCCPGQTPHHIPPEACCRKLGKYDKRKALCICLEGTYQHAGTHGRNHRAIDYVCARKGIKKDQKLTIAEYNKICAQTVETQFGCKKECIEEQLNESMKPTNRKIVHRPSNSNVKLLPKIKATLNKLYKAAAKSSINI